MPCKVCLLIIYNHRYDANIEKLEKIYQSRFPDIYHIVPFYDGTKENVIPVFECSFRFEGYVAQALKDINHSYEHYFFIADDAILNPRINEQNYREWFGLNDHSSFITFTKSLRQMKGWGINRRFMDPFPKFEKYQGTLWMDEIMSADEAFAIAEKQGYGREEFSMDASMVWDARKKLREYPKLILMFLRTLILGRKYCPYPVWGGYSDVFIIPGKDMKEIAHMLGVFAAMDLFVEEAIPTALHLNCEEIVEEEDLKFATKTLWGDAARIDFENKYGKSYRRLVDEWEEEWLFVHPVKLSKWEV